MDLTNYANVRIFQEMNSGASSISFRIYTDSSEESCESFFHITRGAIAEIIEKGLVKFQKIRITVSLHMESDEVYLGEWQVYGL